MRIPISICLSLVLGCSAPAPTADESIGLADATVAAGADAVVSGTGGDGLNLRAEPSRTAEVLMLMPEGARLHVDGTADSGYLAVTYAGTAGFAYAAYLQPVAPPPATLQAAADLLVGELLARSPGTDLALAAVNLATGDSAVVNGDVPHVSASAAKAIWVAAALDGVGVDPVAPHAGPIFRNSDNYESGAVIDLIGPDAVNDFYQKAGMTLSAFTQWSFGKQRVATNSPRALGSDNYFTASDAVTFLGRLDQGTLLSPDATAALDEWMTWTPRSGYGGWVGTELPEAARASLRHKAGWLPPGCCGDDGSYNTLNEIALVDLPDGSHLALALFARHGRDYWGAQVGFVQHAACVLYRTAAHDDTLACP